jgi:ABC-2 type transport system ATP-binding protein
MSSDAAERGGGEPGGIPDGLPALRLDGVTRSYGSRKALDGVSFTVPRLSVLGQVGTKGSGKTTLFSTIAAFLRPDSGTIRILGDHSPGDPALLGRVSILPQDALFDRNLMIIDQLILYRRLQGATAAQATVEVREALVRVGLGEYLDRSVTVLSHGMTKRLGIAQAFLGSPELIFLDEPTAGLDPRNAGRIRRVIRELSEHSTVVVSSHNLAELEDLCDQVAILDRGVIKATGTVAELMERQGRRTLELELPAPPSEELRRQLAAHPGVRSLAGTEGRLAVMLDATGPEPVAAVLRTLLDAGLVPRSFHDGGSLEEVFLSLTDESPE